MRFSLGTFVLFILFVSSAYAVVMLNEPWYLTETRPSKKQEIRFSERISPDGTRRLTQMSGRDSWPSFESVGIFENKQHGSLLCGISPAYAFSARFISDNEISLWVLDPLDASRKSTFSLRIFKRRYVETTFGYMTRPEVLLMLATLGMLIVRMIATIRTKKSKPAVD